MKIEDTNIWLAFLGVAKHGNFTRASMLLNVPLPQISKRISKLEESLGVRLFHRTTRTVTLTDEGKSLLPKVERIFEDLQEVETTFDKNSEFSGNIKITSVPFIAHKLLLPSLNKFMLKYPQLNIELELSENFVNLIEGSFDLALRIDSPKDSNLVYRKLVPNDLVLCAAPSYLKKNKQKLESPSDLHQHSLLALSVHQRVKFLKGSEKIEDFKKSKSIVCENGAFLTDMALAGMGVLLRSKWDVLEHFKKGTLLRVLEKHPLESFGHIYAVVPTRRYMAPRVRSFLEFIVSESQKWSES